MRTSNLERQRNRALRSNMKGALKEFRAITNKSEAEKGLNDAYRAVDKALKGGIIHKNKAARDKSKLSAFVKRLSD